jgi:phenylacetate-CoA ligase
VLEGLRRAAFWRVDGVRGGAIAKHLHDLEELFSDRAKLKSSRLLRTQHLLEHATSTTGFYAPFEGARSLSDFPVTPKDTVKLNYDRFFSRAYARSSLVRMTTSGSYGTPFTFYLSKEKKARQLAEVIFFGRWLGYEVGMRHGYVRVTKVKSRFKLWLQNEILMNPAKTDEAWLETQRRALLTKHVKVLIGYPSAIGVLADYCRQRGDDETRFSLQGVITSAEPLTEGVRDKIQRVFGCPVLSRYSTEEFGVLAHECKAFRQSHLNLASYVIEVLALDEDRPATTGELGRVVVTDLFSHAMPLIRYDTGDLAVLGEPCGCGLHLPTFERLEGRAVETIYDTSGNRVSPFAINGAMRDLEGVAQFQFVQKEATLYKISLRVLPSFAGEALVLERLQAILGADAILQPQYVEEIPPLPSGKRPYIINEWQKTAEAG